MLVTSSQSSTQRPLGLSVEELFALDRQYRRIEQQQQHLAQLQTQARITSSNLNRLTSRSLDLISSKPTSLTPLPSLEIHGHGVPHRPAPPPSNLLNYTRSHSIDQLRYIPPIIATPPPPVIKPTLYSRSAINDAANQNYYPRQRNTAQNLNMTSKPPTTLGANSLYEIPISQNDQYDARNACKLRRQHPIKRESSRRIVVRPVVQRRREPSISSSCESLDELRSSKPSIPSEQSNPSKKTVTFTPSASLIADVINDLSEETKRIAHLEAHDDSSSDDGETNLYEMRVPIGKTYDTSDISVQLEGSKILIHCYTIEPTDKRGNYRKHEFKTELLIPDVVDDETIVSYLTEDGDLIVEGKYQPWAWKEIKKLRKIEKQETKPMSPNNLTSTVPPSTPTQQATASSTIRNDGDRGQVRMSPLLIYENQQKLDYNLLTRFNNPTNKIEKIDNNRTVIHIGESVPSLQQYTDTKSVNDIINRFNALHTTMPSHIWDGQYTFTADVPPTLIYYIRLPMETLMDAVRIQSDSKLNMLTIFIEQQERGLLSQNQQNKSVTRLTSRTCRLPFEYKYDYTRLRVIFLNDNFIRIELPTLK